MTSLKKNFIYSSILTVSNYIFPLLVYPYTSRTLGLNNIGIVNFIDGLINYFILFAMMGITATGIREISICKNDKERLSKAFNSLLCLTTISTFIVIAVLLVSMYTVTSLFQYRTMLYIGICKLFFNIFLIEWFFRGLEDFKFITNRSIIIKIIFVASVFLFVRSSEDYVIFYILSVGVVALNAIVNMIYCRKHVDFIFRGITIRPYLKTFISLGIYLLITSIYTSLNVVWLGFISGTEEVGNYSTATKLHTIIMAFMTAFTSVMFPRVTSLLTEGKYEEFWLKIKQSIEGLFSVAFPLVTIFLVCGPSILHLIAGDGFEGSYTPFRIMAPLILIIGYEQIIVIQVLLAMKKDRNVLINSFIGAAIAIIANMLLVSRLGAVGSSIVWLLSETAIFLASQYVVLRTSGVNFPFASFNRYALTYIPLLAMLIVCNHYMKSWDFLNISVCGLSTLIYSVLVQIYYIKNDLVYQLLERYKLIKR